jgi:hypothetical protein
MQVIVEGTTSTPTSVDSGVPQGTVLGPLLFLCHINDLPEAVKSKVRLFADDCLLYREINSFRDHTALQEDLRSLEEWASRWGMVFNATKCYIMTLARRPPSNFFYSLDNTVLKNVSTNPYLGVQFSNDLKWSAHINYLCKKANSTLGFLRRNLKRCPSSCRRNAYLALVRPLMEYSSTIWDPYQKQDIDRLERIQRNAVRFISGDYRTTTPGFVTGLLAKHKLPPLQDRRESLRLLFFFKVVEGLVPALPPDQFVTPQKQGRQIKSSQRPLHFVSNNPVENYIRNNDRCYIVPRANTEQYRNSYFPRTIIAWNHLDNKTVHSASPECFKSALAKATLR